MARARGWIARRWGERDAVKWIRASGLFDADYYRDRYLSAEPGQVDPIVHFVRVGSDLDYRPCRLFDVAFYKGKYLDISRVGMNPLHHYVEFGWREGRRPNRYFDGDWYLERNPDAAAEGVNPLWHYVHVGFPERRDPGPEFSVARYLDKHPEVAAQGLEPLGHFLIQGEDEGRVPPPSTLQELIDEGLITLRADGPSTGLPESLVRTDSTAMLLAVHEATRTGAPLIALALAERLSSIEGVELVIFLNESGPLGAEFARYGHVVESEKVRRSRTPVDHDSILEMIGTDRFDVALCNSAETLSFAEFFDAYGIPVISLVHEYATSYPKGYFDRLAASSARLVFPSRFVQADARETAPAAIQRGLVIPQGLTKPSLLDVEARRESTRLRVRRSLGLDPDAVIVLGCGYADMRKGIDLFARSAALTLERIESGSGDSVPDVHFVWVGGGSKSFDSPLYWALRDVKRERRGDRVHFVGEKVDPDDYYVAADIFALTSREDPFPCVVLEAMAAGLPVVAFERGGGAPEALAEGAGVVVPYCDAEAMARSIASLAAEPETRRRLGERARERVISDYDFDDYTRNLLDLIEQEAGITAPHPRSRSGVSQPTAPPRAAPGPS